MQDEDAAAGPDGHISDARRHGRERRYTMAIVLDAEKMQTRSQAHPYLMEQLQ